MRDYKFTLRYLMFASFVVVLLVGIGATVNAQNASADYRGSGRDPFSTPRRTVRRTRTVTRTAPAPPGPVAAPPIQQRIDAYRARKQAAVMAQQTPPKPTVALLLSEIQVTGIFRTPRGYAAMVEATPISMSYVIYPGEVFYDGQLVAVEENRLVFRRQTIWTNGRREVAVETKPLRQPNAVTNSLVNTRHAQMSDGAAQQPTSASGATTTTTTPVSSTTHGVEPSSVDRNTISLRAGQYATIRIVGDGSGDLDLYVFDPSGSEIARDISLDDNESVILRAREAGEYRIEVRNLGRVRNEYRLWREQ